MNCFNCGEKNRRRSCHSYGVNLQDSPSEFAEEEAAPEVEQQAGGLEETDSLVTAFFIFILSCL